MIAEAVERYIAYLEALTPAGLDRLSEHCATEVRFSDPFNEVVGLAGYRRVLEEMFEDIGQPDFVVTGRALAGEALHLCWRLSGRGPGGRALHIEGMSEIRFDAAGLVVAHADFWDAGIVYEQIPLLGALIRLVKRRLAVG
ncbi:MAG TPA: nuclear transport factor 2 family protein [Kiloniellaceae bacterium]|nr:nuclear transport factor 2 family protein [Kiloniellaceae bacterium]